MAHILDRPLDHPHGPSCPICILPAIRNLRQESTRAAIRIEELDWTIITKLGPKCDLCKLAVELREHWQSGDADKQMKYDGRSYSLMCENGAWWPPFQPRRRMWTMYTDFDDVLAQRIPTYLISSDPLSDPSKRMFKQWIKKCEDNHPRCCAKYDSLPTRVIDVRHSSLKLLDPSPSGAQPYVALSHCWGSCRDFLTTRDNIELRKAGFQLAELPATFSDAVLVTRALGIPFLWIDSLCIIQGDKEDWEVEGSKMADIYSDATVMVAATTATDDSLGFLNPRKSHRTATLEFVDSPSSSSSSGYKGNKRVARVYVQGDHEVIDRKDRLKERAWCLQERYLSPRILSFEETVTRWECFTENWSENGRGHTNGDSLFTDRDNFTQLYRKWPNMIEHYTRRHLTFRSDALPALSALTARTSQYANDQYLAGLWKKDLLSWLLWKPASYYDTTVKPCRPKDNPAPSWSWASYAGPVAFQLFQGITPTNTMISIPSTVLVDASVSVSGLNPYGEVQSGSVLIRAPVLRMMLQESRPTPEKNWQGYESHILSYPDNAGIEKRLSAKLDYPEESRNVVTYGIPIAHRSGAKYSEQHVAAGNIRHSASEDEVSNLALIYGLLVREQTQPCERRYERVGVFEIGWTPLDRFLDLLKELPDEEYIVV
ncbi:heterokaryon incompatibility protein-domain-containing protein [Pyrenochaeta sp. MPI-SDFR-AT-0127]|nr:heterokaryon incompatibility protein-domain-containing protein [Pyrenochaeta sp. MPI-SDFR-AT-0127]